MARVTTIPATISRFTAAPINEKKKRRTAAYARVSTDSEEQLTSYTAQVDYYTNYIRGRNDWEFVGVYTDEGIGNVKKCAVGKYPKSEKLGSAGQAACCACTHSRYFTGGSPSGLRV